jgi:flagellar FliL protein
MSLPDRNFLRVTRRGYVASVHPPSGVKKVSSRVADHHLTRVQTQGFTGNSPRCRPWHAPCFDAFVDAAGGRVTPPSIAVRGTTMASPEQTAPPAKKSKNTLLMLAVAVIVVGAMGAGGWMMLKRNGAAGSSAKTEQAPALYLQLDPAFVVNFQDDRALRFLQVGVNVMAHDPVAIQATKDAEPVIRNALLMLFSAQDFTALSNVKGKQKLQADALAEIQRVLKEKIGRPGIDAVYFTSFIMQ